MIEAFFAELSPAGKTYRFSGVAIDWILAGKIVEEPVHFNVLDSIQPTRFTLNTAQPSRTRSKVRPSTFATGFP